MKAHYVSPDYGLRLNHQKRKTLCGRFCMMLPNDVVFENLDAFFQIPESLRCRVCSDMAEDERMRQLYA